LADVFDVEWVSHDNFFHAFDGGEEVVDDVPVGGAFKGGFARVVDAILANDFGEPIVVIALVDSPFVGIAAVRVKDVDLAKRLVCVYAHAVVVGGIHIALREGVILLHCACLA